MRTIYFLLFFIVFALPVSAYIDPGTGSMLFSLLTGAAVTLFFFFKNIVIKIKNGSLLVNKKKARAEGQGSRSFLAVYSEGKQYWNVFKPVLEELVRRNIPCTYYSSGEDDPGLLFESPEFIRKEFIGNGNAAYRTLNFLEADFCLMTTPSLDVYQLKRSPGVGHYAHILHMVTDAVTYRLFGLDYFDSVLLTGDYQKKDIRKLESLRGLPEKNLYVAGCTYLDVLAEHTAELPALSGNDKAVKTVLVAPSWGANGILIRYGLKLLEPLAKTSWQVIIRPHPQSLTVEKEQVENLKEALKPYANVEWNFDAENLKALSRADIMISDFSGVIFDYAFLFNRPVLYPRFDFDRRPYDAGDIEDELWTFRAIREIGVPVDEEKFSVIGEVLEGMLKEAGKSEGIKKLREEAWMYQGEAGKRIVNFIEDHLKNRQIQS
jgi:hypothetical protein